MSESMEHAFATVESVESDGLRLQFDGEEEAGDKHYKCNTFFRFTEGDRVYCVKDSGSFVAICKIGAPAASIKADYATNAGAADTATTVDSAEKADSIKDEGQYGTSDFEIKIRYNATYKVYEICSSQVGIISSNWVPVSAVWDEASDAVSYNGKYKIRFRSASGGKLEYCVPYRSSTTWYTIATT